LIHVDRDSKPSSQPVPPWARIEIPLENVDDEERSRRDERRRLRLRRRR
jgi:hypothetical protein